MQQTGDPSRHRLCSQGLCAALLLAAHAREQALAFKLSEDGEKRIWPFPMLGPPQPSSLLLVPVTELLSTESMGIGNICILWCFLDAFRKHLLLKNRVLLFLLFSGYQLIWI